MDQQNQSFVKDLALEMMAPVEIIGNTDAHIKRAAIPPGWNIIEKDDSNKAHTPLRKLATVSLTDAASFVEYSKRHGHEGESTIWCAADYKRGKVDFLCIINDHGAQENQPAWRDHRASFKPEFSEEWTRWTSKHKEPFSQVEFATFIEDNMKDIASVEGQPTGAQMLEMALSFEANQDMRFKSAIRLQNGGVQMSFVQDDDASTLQKMQVFDRFSIGIPTFWNGDAYRVDARLRYRVREGRLSFWFELIRHDKVLEAATQTLIQKIREGIGHPFFYGNPFA